LPAALCWWALKIIIIIIIIIHMTTYMMLSSWPRVIARVQPVYVMNVDSAPDGYQPSDQAKELWF